MKISHNNHSYLSPSKLTSLSTVKTTLLSQSDPDDAYTKTDLDKLIIDKSTTIDNLTSNCNDDETNDNILSMSIHTNEYKSPYRDYLLVANDNSIDYLDYNESTNTNDALSLQKSAATPFRFVNSSDAPLTILPSTTASISTTLPSTKIPSPPLSEFLTKDFTQSNRIQNIDDLLVFTITNTTATDSWNDANSDYARNEITKSVSTRKPLLSAQNRFLSLSISPPLSRRQDMPILRGTFVSL